MRILKRILLFMWRMFFVTDWYASYAATFVGLAVMLLFSLATVTGKESIVTIKPLMESRLMGIVITYAVLGMLLGHLFKPIAPIVKSAWLWLRRGHQEYA